MNLYGSAALALLFGLFVGYSRLDLLPASEQPAIRQLFREYLTIKLCSSSAIQFDRREVNRR